MKFFWLFIVALLVGAQSQGAIFRVTTTLDTTAPNSLRGAIIAANVRGGNNTIILTQSAYQLTIAGADENAGYTGDLDITNGNLTIIAQARSRVTINATGLGDRVFRVLSGANLTLEKLTIVGGTAPGNFYGVWGNGESGGAIFNAGILSLENCIITNNSGGGGNILEGNGGGSGGGDGGGIYNSGFLMVENCIVTGNSAGAGADGAYGGNGGGIKNDGKCVLTDSIISQNQSGAGGGADGNAGGFGGSAGSGGGIYNTGTMIVDKCLVAANVGYQGSGGGDPGIGSFGSPGGSGGSGGAGAGIYNAGIMQVNFSAVCGNISGNGGGGGSFGAGGNGGTGGNGAGILNTGKLNLNTSTISDNLCGNGGSGGGGFFYGGAAGSVGGSGGGIYNSGLLDLTSCTITLNQTGIGGNGGNSEGFFDSSAASGGKGGDGGGILNASDTAVAIRNSLIALNLINVGGAGGTSTDNGPIQVGPPDPIEIDVPAIQTTQKQDIGNTGADGLDFDVGGNFISQRFNLIGMADGSAGFKNGINADLIGNIATPINPLLGSLQMNGGSTPTHALLSGSPAIDRGNSFGVHTDQRGYRRPYNFSSIPNAHGGDGSDIGAFELQPR